MTIDFTEIPPANSSDGKQDRFELFAREMLKTIGFEILEQPDRGADGGKDILVSETLRGINKNHPLTWLVSAKHHAHSGKSVTPSDETNIRERVDALGADGFLGFYSTLPSSGLNGLLVGLQNHIRVDHFDSAAIERYLTTNRLLANTFRSFLPQSYQLFHSTGGYQDSDLVFPIVHFRRVQNPQTRQYDNMVTPHVEIRGNRVLKNVLYSIEESKYTYTGHNPVLAKNHLEMTLYLDTETGLKPFPIPECEEPFFNIHCLIASDIGTFSQNTTVNITRNPLGFAVQHSSISRGGRLIYTRHTTPGNLNAEFVEQVHV